MMKKVLLVATVQSHICQFHRPLAEVLREDGWTIHVAARDNLEEKNGLRLDFADEVYNVPFCRSPLKLKNLVAYRQLKRIICEHCHMISTKDINKLKESEIIKIILYFVSIKLIGFSSVVRLVQKRVSQKYNQDLSEILKNIM